MSFLDGKYFYIYFKAVLLVVFLLSTNCNSHREESELTSLSHHDDSHMDLEISMPKVTPTSNDQYICTSKNIESLGTRFIHRFEPNSNAERAHHMLLYTCDDIHPSLQNLDHWDCIHHASACQRMRIIYAWAKNAPSTTLANDVAFRIGPEAGIKNLVLQVHYAHPLPEGTTDESGFKLHTSSEEPKYLAGIFLLARGSLDIPPHEARIHGDMNCVHNSPAPIHPFAYRVHTHKLGSVVTGYLIKNGEASYTQIAKGNPQWPQAFYPMKQNYTVNPKDIIAARCNFNTTNFDGYTQIGMTAGDEMCNLYVMFYTESRDPEDHFIDCVDEEFTRISKYMPADSDEPLPRNKTLEEHAMGTGSDHHNAVAHEGQKESIPAEQSNANSLLPFEKKRNHAKKRPGADPNFNEAEEESFDEDRTSRKLKSHYHTVRDWPSPNVKLGQATGVDLDNSGNVVVFHRADREWTYSTFDNNNIFLDRSLGPISENTVYVLDPNSGAILHEWGKGRFYIPHDITVAPNGDFFLTDVALHQVFRFEPGKSEPSLVLGEAFKPGKDDKHFCKPAAVAVQKNGEFFVADGYCNSRVIKFSKDGQKILEWGRPFQPSIIQRILPKDIPNYSLSVPHALALAEEEDMIYVADRENGRIQCFIASTGKFHASIRSPLFGRTLYSVSYTPLDGGTLFAVNGADSGKRVQGFVIPVSTKTVSSVFGPLDGFARPHDIIATNNGSSVFVVEIAKPYKIWKFERNSNYQSESIGHTSKGHQVRIGDESGSTARALPMGTDDRDSSPITPTHEPHKIMQINDDSFSNSVIIMAFLTIPLLLLIGIGALLRLRSSTGCCKRGKDTKSFSEFFPPSAGFEKLRMEETDSENSDTEVEEFNATSYRKHLTA